MAFGRNYGRGGRGRGRGRGRGKIISEDGGERKRNYATLVLNVGPNRPTIETTEDLVISGWSREGGRKNGRERQKLSGDSALYYYVDVLI